MGGGRCGRRRKRALQSLHARAAAARAPTHRASAPAAETALRPRGGQTLAGARARGNIAGARRLRRGEARRARVVAGARARTHQLWTHRAANAPRPRRRGPAAERGGANGRRGGLVRERRRAAAQRRRRRARAQPLTASTSTGSAWLCTLSANKSALRSASARRSLSSAEKREVGRTRARARRGRTGEPARASHAAASQPDALACSSAARAAARSSSCASCGQRRRAASGHG